MTIGYKYAVVLQKKSGLTSDEVVNDWYTNTVLDAGSVTSALINFYVAIGAYFSPAMSGGWTVNQYAIPDTRPAVGVGFGPPVSVHTGTMGAGTGSGLPAQLSAVLSFHADFTGIPEHGPSKTRPRATRRGRVYLGELNTSCLNYETTGATETELGDPFIGIATSAASTLLHVTGLGWSVFSKKNWALYPVIGGWMDDSPDVTRRRKIAADSRTSWS